MPIFTGTSADELLVGEAGGDTLEGKTGNDTLQGGAGSDLYIFRQGDGQDEIEDNGFVSTDRLEFVDYAVGDASFSRPSAGDTQTVLISFANGDSVTILNGIGGSFSDAIEEVAFTDQTLSVANIRARILENESTSGDDTLIGYANADTLQGGQGDDSLSGGRGQDTYLFAAGDGADTIADGGLGEADTLTFTNYNAAAASILRATPGNASDVLIDFGNGDSVTLVGILSDSFANAVETIEFTDLVTLDATGIRVQILAGEATSGADSITGFATADTLEGGTGNDTISGGGGEDLYVYNIGDGRDLITEGGFRENDEIEFTGYASTDASFEAFGALGVKITFSASDWVEVTDGISASVQNLVENYRFTDLTLTAADLRTAILSDRATAGDDTVQGYDEPDTITGAAGADLLIGGRGGDAYVFRAGDGDDTIRDEGFDGTDEIQLPDYDLADAALLRSGNSLILGFENGDQVTLTDALGNAALNAIESYAFRDQTLSREQIIPLAFSGVGTDGNDRIEGFFTDDTLEGGLGSDILLGGRGSDTYLYAAGDGFDEIREEQTPFVTEVDRLIITGYTSADLSVVRTTFTDFRGGTTRIESPSDHALLDFGVERIRILNGLSGSTSDAIEEIVFSDVTLTPDDLRALAVASDTVGNVFGYDASDDILDPGPDFDPVYPNAKGAFGYDGSDTYLYDLGDGTVSIEDRGSGDTDRVVFRDLDYADIVEIREFSSPTIETYYRFRFSGATLNITDAYGETVEDGIEEYEFANGDVFTAAEMRALKVAGESTAGDDTVTGFGLSDTLEAGGGDDTVIGRAGDDTYVYRAGDGSDLYVDTGGEDRIVLTDYARSDVSFAKDSSVGLDSLRINLADGGQILVEGGAVAGGSSAIETLELSDVTLTLADILADLSFAAKDDILTVSEDAMTGGSLFADNGFGPDFDSEGNALTVTAVEGDPLDPESSAIVSLQITGPGQLFVDADGTWNVDFDGSLDELTTGEIVERSFTYTITEAGQGQSDQATVTVFVEGVNDAPLSGDHVFEAVENVPLEITLASLQSLAPDPDDISETLTFALTGTPANGAAEIDENGNLIYTPGLGFFGTDSVAYSLTDDEGAAGTGSLIFEVEAFIEGYDLALSDIALTSGKTGEDAVLTYRLDSVGELVAEGLAETEIWLSADSVIDADDILLTIHRPFLQMVPGTGVDITHDVTLPDEFGAYTLIGRTLGVLSDPENLTRLDNNLAIGDAPVSVVPEYKSDGGTTRNDYFLGEDITVIGFTRDSLDPFEPIETAKLVELRFVSATGATETAFTVSDNQGIFETDLRLDAGIWEVNAFAVGFAAEDAGPEAVITVTGIAFDDATPSLEAIPGETLSLRYELSAFGADFTGLTLDFGNAASWITGHSIESSVNAGGSATLTLDFLVPEAAVGENFLEIGVESDEGAAAALLFDIDVAPPTPVLEATPDGINSVMLRGETTYYSYTIENTGGMATSELEVILPTGVDWLDLVSLEIIDSLEPGETATITLSASPDAELALGSYGGDILVRGEIASELLDLQLRTIDSGEATLIVRVEDEDTYFDAENGFPLVEDARIELIDALTLEVVYSNEDVDGEVTIDGLTPGLYELRTYADGHAAARELIELPKGETTTFDSFITQENVTYNWTVTETEIEDRYDVAIEAEFSTRIPAPTVVLDTNTIDLADMEVGETRTFIVTATNVGMIAANNVGMFLPAFENYDVEFLDNPLHTATRPDRGQPGQAFQGIDRLEAGEETFFAYEVTYAGGQTLDTVALASQMSSDAPECAPPFGFYYYDYPCGQRTVEKGGGIAPTGLEPFDDPECFGFDIANPSGWVGGQGRINPTFIYEECSPLCPDQPNLPLCIPGGGPFNAAVLCGIGFGQTTWNTVVDGNGEVLPNIENPEAVAQNYLLTALGCVPVLGDIICAGQWSGWLVCAALGKASGPLNLPAANSALASGALSGFEHGSSLARSDLEADALSRSEQGLSLGNSDLDYDALSRFEQGLWLDQAILELEPYAYATYTLLDEITGNADAWLRAGRQGDGKSVETIDFAFLAAALPEMTDPFSKGGSLILLSEISAEIAKWQGSPIPFHVADSLMDNFAVYWNGDLLNRFDMLGVDFTDGAGNVIDRDALFAAEDLEWGSRLMDIDAIVAAGEVASPIQTIALDRGFEGLDEFLVTTSERTWDFLSEVNDGVCAKVQVQISQGTVMARQAFEATLEIENIGVDALSDLEIEIRIRNVFGEEVDPSLFTISAPVLSGGLTATDGTGTLVGDATGKAVFTITPNAEAALDGEAQYGIEGTLTYMEGPVPQVVELYSMPVTVEPQASLVLDYFQSREVVGDDPLTTLVEPSSPFTLAVRVSNEGAGDARDLTISSAEPEIIDNEIGLQIDFDLLGTDVNGTGISPGLSAEIGDLGSGETAVASWTYTSSLAGRFDDFSATYSHVNAIGDGQSSQIAEVNIHELIREVKSDLPGSDDLPDYIVTAVDDLLWLPDTIFYSDGGQADVSTVVGTATSEISNDTLTTTLTTEMATGWSYVRSLDPALGGYRLTEVHRSDGSLVAEENWWRTDRTFYNQGAPDYEDILHILDHNTDRLTETYTLTYVTLDALAGTNGRDQLYGDDLANSFAALAGNDYIAPGLGDDDVSTGRGADTVTGTAAELDGDRITDFGEGDEIVLIGVAAGREDVTLTEGSAILDIDTSGNGVGDTTITLDGDFSGAVFEIAERDDATVISLAGPEAVRLSPAGERFITTDRADNKIYGGAGDDFVLSGNGGDLVTGQDGSDVLLGGFGDDTLVGGAGNDVLTGGNGADVFVIDVGDFAGFGIDTITDFTPGEDKVVLAGFGETSFVSFGNDVAINTGVGGFITLEGLTAEDLSANDIEVGAPVNFALIALEELHRLTPSSDRFVTSDPGGNIVFADAGADAILTSDGDDVVDGGDGSDVLSTGAGADTLRGGAGNDILSGGTGEDVFEFVAGGSGFITDTITDFEIGTDSIALSGYADPNILTLGGSAALQLTEIEFVVLENVTQTELESRLDEVLVFV